MTPPDVHVHVGYFNCRKCGRVEYYSPRRVIGVLNRCGVDEFVVSSTSAQAAGITAKGILDEAREVKRIAGNRARQFLWVTWELYQANEWQMLLDAGLYSGIKLHEQEGHWAEHHRLSLEKVLEVARERKLPVQFHSGPDAYCSPRRLMQFAERYSDVRFDFAHCRPMDEMALVMARCGNVWTDTAYMAPGDFEKLSHFDWHLRLMFGTDIPVWQAYEDVSLTRRYREYVTAWDQTVKTEDAAEAFRAFLGNGRGFSFQNSLALI